MNFHRLAKKQTGLGPPSPTASGTGSFGGGSKAIYGLAGVLATTQLVRGATVSGTGIAAGTRIEEILNDTTIIIDTATTIPGLSVALTFDEIFPYGSVATDGTSIFLSGKDHRPIDIGSPIGVILAWHPRLFSGAGNVGVDSSDRTSLPDNYRLCDGSDITSTGSPLVNGGFNRLPELTDNRFLMGGINNTLLGDNFVYGGANHAGPPLTNGNNGNNSISISTNFLPPHTHGPGTLDLTGGFTTGSTNLAHTHSVTLEARNAETGNVGNYLGTAPFGFPAVYGTSWSLGLHSHTLSVGSGGLSFSGATDNGGFFNKALSVLPKYLTVKFIMRIK